ncbi:MAG: helix-turn-helix domain-containing protein [Trebonia sp.]
MANADDAILARRVLKGQLREARTAAGLTREDAADALVWSLSKLLRIEAGDQGVSITDLRAMMGLYGVTDAVSVQHLTGLARNSRRPAWWSGYRFVISKAFSQLLGFESVASAVRTFHPLLFPGVLHTAEYAYALLRTTKTEEAAQTLVRLRMERQERLLNQDSPPKMTFVFAEEAFNRLIGGPDVMRGQLRYLLSLADHPMVTLQVVPLSANEHSGLSGPFNLLDIEETDEVLLFLESAAGDIASRDQEMIKRFIDNFEKLRGFALSASETRELINQRLELLEQSGAPS